MDWARAQASAFPWQQVTLFAPAPFHFNPLKAYIAPSYASEYAVSFEHFYRDHHTFTNLWAHVVALVIQLLTNAALLASLEDLCGGAPLLRLATLGLLAYPLATVRGCPPAARAAALLSLAIASAAGRRIAKHWRFMVYAQGAVVALAVDALVVQTPPRPLNVAGVFFAFAALAAALGRARGALAPYRAAVNAVVVAIAVHLSTKEDPLRGGLVHFGAFVIWVPALLTDQPWLFFWGCGFVATVCQAVTHFVTDKPATMIQLQDTYGRGELGYEWAHVLYFPNLVFHAVLASGGGD